MRSALAAAAAASCLLAGPAAAETYPTHPISLVVPYAVGGSADVLARILANRMQVPLGKPVAVVNVVGAAGNIATARVAKAAPDGHTIALGTWSTHVANAAVYALPYDPVSDFAPI